MHAFAPSRAPARATAAAAIACMIALVSAGCAGPAGAPSPATPSPPATWRDWHAGDAPLALPDVELTVSAPASTAERWAAFGDPLLARLIDQAVAASPDLQLAMLRVLEARASETTVSAQHGPQVGARGGVERERLSEIGSATRLINVIGGSGPFDKQALIAALAQPFDVWQAGFDASWELDLWGRVRHAEELARAQTDEQRALLQQARLTLSAEIARGYLELRATQRQRMEVQAQAASGRETERLLDAQRRGGLADETLLLRQQAANTDLDARVLALRAQEAATLNRLALLCGQRPGALDTMLAATDAPPLALPPLAPGLPSDLVRHRPDVAAAEARLAQATAGVGIATADLYPRITLGASFGTEALHTGDVADWGSRQWSVGPAISLPIFDHGRRRATVGLRTLQQREAATAWQQVVLRAWHEVDDALAAYQADRLALASAQEKSHRADDTLSLARAREAGGLTDGLPTLDAERGAAEARRQVAEFEGRLATRLVAVYKALGNDGSLASNSDDAPATADVSAR